MSFVSFGDYDECYITKHTNLVVVEGPIIWGPSYVLMSKVYVSSMTVSQSILFSFGTFDFLLTDLDRN